MSLSDELLEAAKYLLRQNSNKPSDAAIRRSISTAYYALFHLLIEAATSHLVTEVTQQAVLARTFDHSKMKQVCKSVKDDKLPFLGSAVPDELKQLATTFVELQEQRHDADYNRTRTFAKAEAKDFVMRAEVVFSQWAAVRPTPIAGPFLLLLLVGEPKAR